MSNTDDGVSPFDERIGKFEAGERKLRRVIAKAAFGTEAEAEEHTSLPTPVEELVDDFVGFVQGSSDLFLDAHMGSILVGRLLILWHEGRVKHAVRDETPTQYLQRLEAFAPRLLDDGYRCPREFVESFIAEVETQLAKVGSQGT
ncbi:MAG: hypothetical protein OXF01_08265 [Gemmatimonadetes bacterium]|nr:hypothetical protein [Gemmatimonadota bacterium]